MQQWCMLWIPLFWGIVLCQWVTDFSGFKILLPQNFRNQFPVMWCHILEEWNLQLHHCKDTVYLTFCVCSLSKVTLKISRMYIYYGKKYRTVYTDGRHTDSVYSISYVYMKTYHVLYSTLLYYHSLYSQHEWRGTLQSILSLTHTSVALLFIHY
jgi:hypothetical protein